MNDFGDELPEDYKKMSGISTGIKIMKAIRTFREWTILREHECVNS
jgi:hypothetical protein